MEYLNRLSIFDCFTEVLNAHVNEDRAIRTHKENRLLYELRMFIRTVIGDYNSIMVFTEHRIDVNQSLP